AKGPAHQECCFDQPGPLGPGRKREDMTKPEDKPFVIPKLMVWEAWRHVKENKGAPGVDGQDLDEFEADLKGNLYKLWNSVLDGSYFPPPVRAVEVPKPHGGGVRLLGVPTVADRVAQTVVARRLEGKVEAFCHRGGEASVSCGAVWALAGVGRVADRRTERSALVA